MRGDVRRGDPSQPLQRHLRSAPERQPTQSSVLDPREPHQDADAKS
ncbi:hypothetical protein EVA_06257 [gut metagenome]|uniref:Uncharacterized protein n=1 Tax=gut metagenome TaxID=749906 RepID=J9GFD0_9ZZZZ